MHGAPGEIVRHFPVPHPCGRLTPSSRAALRASKFAPGKFVELRSSHLIPQTHHA